MNKGKQMNNMIKFQSYSGLLTWFTALLLSALVAGCGFDGDNSIPAVPATTTASGVAASGAPIVGAMAQMVCAGGTPGTAVSTGKDGGFTVIAPLTAPCVIKVSGATGAIGGPLFSVVASSSQTRANVNQLTHMLAFLLAGGDPDTGLFQSPSSISSKITATAVAKHKATITASVIANLGAAAGIPTSFDFLEGTFAANHTGFDLVLDKIGFTAVGNTVSIMLNGAPLLAVNATTGVASTTSSTVISNTSLSAASTFGAPVTAKAVTALSFAGLPAAAAVIDETAKTIAVTVPSGTNVTALVANFAVTGANVKVGAALQTSGVTANDFTNPVAFTVTDANGVTATYTVTVTVASATAKAATAFSFAGITGAAGTIDEAAKTIAVTVPNGTDVKALVATFATTGVTVKVGTTVQTSGVTANDFTNPVAFAVTDANGVTATYTVAVTVASVSAKASTAFSFAGIPGAAGTINETAKTVAVTVPFGTDVTSLAATFATTGAVVKVGTTLQTSGVTLNNFTSPVNYIVTAADGTTATYAVTVTVAPNSAKTISAYSFAGFTGAAGTVDEAAKTVAVTVPNGAAVTALVATFATTGASVKVGTAVQTSTATANNFTNPVAYLVTAADGTTATYIVTVTVAPSSLNTITAYSFVGFPASPGVIADAAKTIAVTVPNGTAVTALVATFTTTGAGVKVGTTVQTSTATANNFTNPVAYIVTAADGSTATYTVTVTIGAAVTVLPGPAGSLGAAATNPTVISSSASNGDTNVPTRTHNGSSNLVTVKLVTATFNEPMNPTTITPVGKFTLKDNTLGIDVPGTVTMNSANTIATFTPTATALNANTSYTATVTTAAKNAGSITATPNPVAWSFTTMGSSFANQSSPFVGQAPVDLLSAGNFVILAKTTITDVPSSAITGNIGVSPAAGSFIGVTCAEMTGTIYTVDATYVGSGNIACVAAGPGANKTLVDNAILDMGTARAEAAARTLPDATELGAGDISGLTIYPGLYKWSTNVAINADVTLDAKGDTNAVWIFQIGLDLPVAAKGSVVAGVKVILAGGAKASNIFWQVGGLTGATLGTYSTFNGTILSAKQAIANTGAVVNGRLFADSQVTLQQNPVTKPAP